MVVVVVVVCFVNRPCDRGRHSVCGAACVFGSNNLLIVASRRKAEAPVMYVGISSQPLLCVYTRDVVF
jgi:hypothetical protein